ncbi:SubName: Full=Uncharacterized protein {ECO:0000313/EMBL:CCA68094.1} [Serendipita indica DSM 11827]|uniref:Uncharacterized protein n=1 Tax=Serendipita indica (strain DSM 11827) TaxID=1109443 RepID=G4T9U1_SERID|nr:SubName: Full=Uncharacterized protein {ECO:0000313/EMBL:CCA68094.1} [Serendipita indica DSM 11827]CCA68094.1 hypothetical protein PIIN_01962 [Serendipita indica DSM 11827]
MSEEGDAGCNSVIGDDYNYHQLRIASIFIIMASSGIGAFFPLIAKRTLRLPASVYDFAKYFGSGVIIATAFIHLLTPGFEALGSPCLHGIWTVYPWPAAISMASVFFIFFIELFAFRWGTARLKAQADAPGIINSVNAYDAHGHAHGGEGMHAAHGPEPELASGVQMSGVHQHGDNKVRPAVEKVQPTHQHSHAHQISLLDHPLAQAISILILEFGVLFHSFIIGMTLAVSTEFIVILVVLTFHQLFEGLGLGTRLAHLQWFERRAPRAKSSDVEEGSSRGSEDEHIIHPKLPFIWAVFPWIGAGVYSLSTPLGIAIGLAVKATYAPESATASIVSGVFDSFSSGILLYTGLVELLAHEFLFSKTMREKPTGEVVYAGACVVLGAGLMALLGRWA